MKKIFVLTLVLLCSTHAEAAQIFAGDAVIGGKATHLTLALNYQNREQIAEVQNVSEQTDDGEGHFYVACTSHLVFQIGTAKLRMEQLPLESIEKTDIPLTADAYKSNRIADPVECQQSRPAYTQADLVSAQSLYVKFPIAFNRSLAFGYAFIRPTFGTLQEVLPGIYKLDSLNPSEQKTLNAVLFIVDIHDVSYERAPIALTLQP